MARQPFPGLITGVEPQAKTRKHLGARVNVFINDRFSFALDASLAQQRALEAGVVLDAARLEEILAEDGDAKAYARAMHFMSYRTRSAKEIRERLARDEWPEAVIARVLQRLVSEKWLDDASFAAAWVVNRSLTRPRGGRALTQELRQKGVAREEIEAALPDAEQELENAAAAVRPKLRLWEKFDERERRNKAIEFLQRRGFNYSIAKAALAQLAEDDES